MNFFHLDHIGIAVQSIEESSFFYHLLGLKASSHEDIKSEGVRASFYKMKNGVNLELLEPLNQKSPISRFIKKRGEGIHHICLRVKNLEKILEKLKKFNILLIDEKPRIGAFNRKVTFIHPRSTHGVLYELVEE